MKLLGWFLALVLLWVLLFTGIVVFMFEILFRLVELILEGDLNGNS